jgi:hypothetical protein
MENCDYVAFFHPYVCSGLNSVKNSKKKIQIFSKKSMHVQQCRGCFGCLGRVLKPPEALPGVAPPKKFLLN